MIPGKLLLLPLLLSGILIPAALAADREQASKYEVPADLRKAMTARAADLAGLSIGVGPFRHLHAMKLRDLGFADYDPSGEALLYDFSKSIPPEWKGLVRDGAVDIDSDKAEDRVELLSGNFRDYDLQVSVRWLGGVEKSGFGLVLNGTGADGFHWLVTAGASSNFVKWKGGRPNVLQDWNDVSSYFKKDAANVLRVLAQGGKFTCSVNGTEVFSFTDSEVGEGRIGIILTNKLHVAFDDLAIQPLEVSEREGTLGSGYDYAEEVLTGIASSKLFEAGKLGLSNFPPNESWDYVVEAARLGFPHKGDVKVVVRKQGRKAPVLEETLPLPADWSRKPAAWVPGGTSPREAAMTKLGEFLAFRLAQDALGEAAGGRR